MKPHDSNEFSGASSANEFSGAREPSMNASVCEQVELALIESGEHADFVAEHLATCSACAETAAAYARISSAYRELPDAQPTDALAANVMAAARAELVSNPPPRESHAPSHQRLTWRRAVALAASLVALVGLYAWFQHDRPLRFDNAAELLRQADASADRRQDFAALELYLALLGQAGAILPEPNVRDVEIGLPPTDEQLAHAMHQAAILMSYHDQVLDGAALLGELNARFPNYAERRETLRLQAVWLAEVDRFDLALAAIATMQSEYPDALQDLKEALIEHMQNDMEHMGHLSGLGYL